MPYCFWKLDREDFGYPHPICGDWKHGLSVWANTDIPLMVIRDARFYDEMAILFLTLIYMELLEVMQDGISDFPSGAQQIWQISSIV